MVPMSVDILKCTSSHPYSSLRHLDYSVLEKLYQIRLEKEHSDDWGSIESERSGEKSVCGYSHILKEQEW